MQLNLAKPFFALAPMDDVTTTVFRQVIASCYPPDVCFSEFVNVDGLMSSGRKHLLNKLDRAKTEPPLIAHIWGLKPDNFYAVAEQIASGQIADELGLNSNFVGIDLNMGCPVRDVVKIGACSALINNHGLAQEIIEATKKGANNRLPISIKTRLGFSKIQPEWSQFIFRQDVAMLSVHLRTAKEMSLAPAHYEELARLKKERDKLAPNTLLAANGDIKNRQHGQQIIDQYGVDGVMIGRAIFQDPFAFSNASPWQGLEVNSKIALLLKHIELLRKWATDPDKHTKQLNKYAKIYLAGFAGAKELREKLASSSSLAEMLGEIQSFQSESV